MKWTPNRIVAFGGGLLALIAGVAGAAAGIAPAGAAVMLVSIAAAAGLAREWLIGWREYEARQGEADQPVDWDDAEELVKRLAANPEALREVLERVRGARAAPE